MRKPKCSICASENLAQINALLESGLKLKTIVDQIPGLSPHALSRHRKNCLVPALSVDTFGILGEAERWMERADAQYLTASGVDGDTKSALQACQIAFRGLETRLRAQQREAETVPESGTVAPITLEQLDTFMADADARETPETRLIRAVVWEFERSLTYNGSPVFFDLVERMFRERLFDSVLADAELLVDFLNYKRRRVAEGDRVDLDHDGRTNASLSQSHSTD